MSKFFKFPNIPIEYWRENDVAYQFQHRMWQSDPDIYPNKRKDGDPGVQPSQVNRVLPISNKVPRVWFFGDSFVQFPSENIWSHITKRLNCVHAGVGGGGIVKLYHSLMVCKEYMEPEDRVVICYSHPCRDVLASGHRGRYSLDPIPQRIIDNETAASGSITDGICTISKSEDNNYMWQEGWETKTSASYEDKDLRAKVLKDYTSYVNNVKWKHGDSLRWHAIVTSIESVIIPNLVTPFVSRFSCFENSLNKRLTHRHHRIDIPSSIEDLYPLWTFAQKNVIDFNLFDATKSPNHMTDDCVSAFLLTYKKELRKLRLDSI